MSQKARCALCVEALQCSVEFDRGQLSGRTLTVEWKHLEGRVLSVTWLGRFPFHEAQRLLAGYVRQGVSSGRAPSLGGWPNGSQVHGAPCQRDGRAN